MKTIRIISLVLALIALFALSSCGKEEKGDLTVGDAVFTPTEEVTDFVCIQMDSGKKIVLELYPESAPITVKNFQDLVAKDFYDGLTFHRVSPMFVIQGGDPEGTGMGGPGYEIKGEFSANGVENNISHERGVISMARSSLGYDTAGSQFFICLSTEYCRQLDGQYAAFGRVIAGLEVVDEIASVRVAGETPLEKQVMKEVYFVKEAQ